MLPRIIDENEARDEQKVKHVPAQTTHSQRQNVTQQSEQGIPCSFWVFEGTAVSEAFSLRKKVCAMRQPAVVTSQHAMWLLFIRSIG